MGFKRDKRQFLLKFADDQQDMAGFECKVGSLSIGKFIRFTKALAAAGAATAAGTGGDGGAEANRLVMSTLVANIVEWNLEDDDDRPVPIAVAVCTESGKDIGDEGLCPEHAEREQDCPVTGLYAYDIDFAMSIATAWMQGMAGVAAPLGSDSPSGKPSLEGSLPMEIP